MKSPALYFVPFKSSQNSSNSVDKLTGIGPFSIQLIFSSLPEEFLKFISISDNKIFNK